jgi:uncharacterized protein YbjT (DUF2867 family)
MAKTAVVAGSTGLVGNQLIKILAQSLEYEAVIAVVRKGSSIIYDGVFTIEVDYRKLFEFAEALKADDVYCCLGTTMKKAGSKANFYQVDYTYPLELAKIAERNGSDRFSIITASGANSDSMFYYNRVKGDVEKAIMNLNIPNINIFRPSLLLGERNEKRKGEHIGGIIAKMLNPLLQGKLRRYRAIQGADVAKTMYLVNQQNQKGKYVYESDKIQELSQG